MALSYLYETTAISDDVGTVVPVRVTNGGGYNHPSMPGGFVEGRVAKDSTGLSLQRSVFQAGAFGGGETEFGVVEIVNIDGGSDALIDYGWGRPATLKLGDDEGPYSGFIPVITARASKLIVSETTLSIAWEGRMRELDEPACPATYAGTNSGTTGLEGTADGLKGTKKPWAIGRPRGIEPDLVNAARRIFAWNFSKDGTRRASASLDALRYQGALWTDGSDFATSDALIAYLDANSVAQGTYVTCLAESLVAMGGSSPLSGAIRLDVTVEPLLADRAAAKLWRAVLRRAGVAAADIGSIDALPAYEANHFARDESFLEIADALSASIAAGYAPDRFGVYQLYQMGEPSGTPVAGFKRLEYGTVQGPNDGDLVSIQPAGSDAWTPLKQVRVAYARMWSPLLDSDVAAAVSADDKAFLTQEWRYATQTAAAVAVKYANAESRDYQSCLCSAADAAAIGIVYLGIFSKQRREYQATVSYGAAFAALLDLGAVIRVTHPRFGMAAGRLARIHTIRLRDTTQEADIKIWL